MNIATLFTAIPLCAVIIITIVMVVYKRSQQSNQRRHPHTEPFLGTDTLDEPPLHAKASSVADNVSDDEWQDNVRVVSKKSHALDAKSAPDDDTEIDTEIAATATPIPGKPALKPARRTPDNSHGLDLIVININANVEHPYSGYELLQAILASGMRYGRMNIFHRYEDANGRGTLLFSLASAVKPGIFELTKMGSFSTPGLTLFLRVSALKLPLTAFETLLETAQQLVDDLGGELLDEQRLPLSEEKITEWRNVLAKLEEGAQTADLF